MHTVGTDIVTVGKDGRCCFFSLFATLDDFRVSLLDLIIRVEVVIFGSLEYFAS